ncbi:DoxX family protein [Runella sp.]|uniref:DoxX family protein n=1 Tax=Runella sp. TaxID=1960881 RepID=UPI003D12F0CA
MKPLFVLLGTFGISLLATYFFTEAIDYPLSGRIAMSAMLVFTAIGHFAFTKGMAMMVPDFIPFKTEMVYATGVIELLAAIGLLIPGLKVLAAWALILFFIVLLPGNIKAAIKRIDYEKGTYEGKGITYLWFRVPLQILFIAWTYLSAIMFP